MGSFSLAGWSDPDTRAAGLIVLGCLALLVTVSVVFRDVNAA